MVGISNHYITYKVINLLLYISYSYKLWWQYMIYYTTNSVNILSVTIYHIMVFMGIHQFSISILRHLVP